MTVNSPLIVESSHRMPLYLTLATFLVAGMPRCSLCSPASTVALLCLLFRGGEVRSGL